MFFFYKFPKTDYAFISDPTQKRQVTNILTAFFLRKVGSLKKMLFQKYTIRDDDSIESLSEKLYKDPLHYWTLLVVNDIIDPYSEWAKPFDILEKFVTKKYADGVQSQKVDGTITTLPASQGLEGVHHFFNVMTDRVCDDVEDEYYRSIWLQDPARIGKNIIPVTNFEYEREVDISKRQIMAVLPVHVTRFEEDFAKMLQGK